MNFGDKLIEIAVAYWDIMLASSVFILFGFLVAGLLKGFLPTDFIERHLGKKSKTGILKAAVFGVPLPL